MPAATAAQKELFFAALGAYARYVTAGDIGSATGPLLGWIAVDFFGYAAVGLLLGSAVYLSAALVSRIYLR